MTLHQLACVPILLACCLWSPLKVGAQSATRAAAVPKEVTIRFEGGLVVANFGESSLLSATAICCR